MKNKIIIRKGKKMDQRMEEIDKEMSNIKYVLNIVENSVYLNIVLQL